MKALLLRTALVFAVIFILPLGLFAEPNTDDGASLSGSIMPVPSNDGDLQTDGHNPNYRGCQFNYGLCMGLASGSHKICSMIRNVCYAGCEIDTIARGRKNGLNMCYQKK